MNLKPSKTEATVWADAVRIAGPFNYTGNSGARRYFKLVQCIARGILFGVKSCSPAATSPRTASATDAGSSGSKGVPAAASGGEGWWSVCLVGNEPVAKFKYKSAAEEYARLCWEDHQYRIIEPALAEEKGKTIPPATCDGSGKRTVLDAAKTSQMGGVPVSMEVACPRCPACDKADDAEGVARKLVEYVGDYIVPNGPVDDTLVDRFAAIIRADREGRKP